jgi:serine/threonine protein kinase
MDLYSNQPQEFLFEPGTVIAGRYEVVGQLGKGGMGVVLRVIDRALDNEPAAIKLLYPHHVNDNVLFARFRNEVLVARQLAHPNIVRLYDFGSAGGGYYFISMEYVQGYSLKDRIHSPHYPQLDFPEICRILYEVGSGLAYAHRKGVIHRDIKPDNILLTPGGDVRITDFGLARTMQLDKGFTQTGETVGTPCYMAPEQINGKKVDGRADIYSLGIMAYEMATGERPFEDDSWMILAKMHLQEPMPRFAKATGLPEWFEQFVIESAAKKPEERFQTADEWCETLLSHIKPGKKHVTPAVFSTGVVAVLKNERKRKRLFRSASSLLLALAITFTLSVLTIAAIRNIPSLKRASIAGAVAAGDLLGSDLAGLKRLLGLNLPLTPESFSHLLEQGDLAGVRLLHSAGMNFDGTGISGEPMLIEAIKAKQPEIAAYLLAKGVSWNVESLSGEQALHLACSLDLAGVVDELLKRGADINMRDSLGRTPLMLAAVERSKAAVQLLLARGALVSLSDETAEAIPTLVYAVRGGDITILQELLAKSGRAEQLDAKRQTPLMHAAMLEREDMIELLLAGGADREKINIQGKNFVDFLPTRLRSQYERKVVAGRPAATASTTASSASAPLRMTRLRVIGEPQMDIVAARTFRLRALSVQIRNVGDEQAEGVSVTAVFPDGTKLRLQGPQQMTRNTAITFKANINGALEVSSAERPRIEVSCDNCFRN